MPKREVPPVKNPISDINEASSTRDKILLEAAILFSQNGFAAVSVRDIAKKVNIKAASIYNHFENKEALWVAVVENIRSLYIKYYERLDGYLEKASSFDEALECLFFELTQISNMFIYYGGSVIVTEQFRDKNANKVHSEILLDYSINYIKKVFDDCVRRGEARPFDTKTAATLMMHSVIVGTTERAHEDLGHPMTYDVTEMFKSIQKFFSDNFKAEKNS